MRMRAVAALVIAAVALSGCIGGGRRTRPTESAVAVASTAPASAPPASAAPSTPVATSPVASTPPTSPPTPLPTPHPTEMPTPVPPSATPTISVTPPPATLPPLTSPGVRLVVTGGSAAGTYEMKGATGTCLIGFRTTTDFYFTGGLFNSAKPKDPTNFRLQVSIPDPATATTGTDTFSATAGFGDPAANVSYSIDTTATGTARMGSGTATLTVDAKGASVTFSGQAARVGQTNTADVVRLDGAVRCTTVLHPRG